MKNSSSKMNLRLFWVLISLVRSFDVKWSNCSEIEYRHLQFVCIYIYREQEMKTLMKVSHLFWDVLVRKCSFVTGVALASQGIFEEKMWQKQDSTKTHQRLDINYGWRSKMVFSNKAGQKLANICIHIYIYRWEIKYSQ